MADRSKESHELLDFARSLAQGASDIIMPYFERVSVETKPDGTEVTDADRRAEEYIRAELARHCPDAAVLGEEFGGEPRPLYGDQWIVDPLDGTSSFVLGLPLFGTLIGLLRDGSPVLGVVHMPALGQTLYACTGAGCWFVEDGTPPQLVRCEMVGSLRRAYVSVGGLHTSALQPMRGQPPYRLDRLIEAAGRFRIVSDCIQHALVCRGRLHVAIDPVMAPWDSAALVPCVREAGGSVSSVTGETADVVFSGSLLTAADPALHREVLAALSCR